MFAAKAKKQHYQPPEFLDLDPQVLLAVLVYMEARGEGSKGMQAVLNVVYNRIVEGGWWYDWNIFTKTNSPYHAVVLRPIQFTVMWDALGQKTLNVAENFDAYMQQDPLLQTAYDLAGRMLEGTLPDITRGAVAYHPSSLKKISKSFNSYTKVAKIGNHIFYA